MNHSTMSRWTRDGILPFAWNEFETFERLVLNPELSSPLKARAQAFQANEALYRSLRLPWRHGIFFYGPPGSGKTAASKAMARVLGWSMFMIPAHEILNSHLLEKALAEAVCRSKQVVVLDDVDRMIQTMETGVFCALLDHAMERSQGVIWIATCRHPEDAPKTQLLRPGRFDESYRMTLPNADLRRRLFTEILSFPIELDQLKAKLEVPLKSNSASILGAGEGDLAPESLGLVDSSEASGNSDWSSCNESLQSDESLSPNESWGLHQWIQNTQGLSFSHFEELRQIQAQLKMDQKSEAQTREALKSFVEDLLIASDRFGGLSDATEELKERVNQIDAKVLMAALDMSDVFRRLIEKVIGDAAVQSSYRKLDGSSDGGSQ
ncbi:MAG: AAA family ATPase [Bdellovibrionia bacterium]